MHCPAPFRQRTRPIFETQRAAARRQYLVRRCASCGCTP